MADIKPVIKPDPEAVPSPSTFEEDIYEDAGDLEFNTDPLYSSAYLTRIPRHLWEAWSSLDEDAEIEIGKVRIEYVPREDGSKEDIALAMLLDSNLAQHQGVEKEYKLEVNSENVTNTFIFTEQDLPGFKSKSRPKAFDMATANMPARFQRQKKEESLPKQPFDPNKRFQPYFKKAIPKRTILKARVRHDVSANPVDNEESRYLMAIRTREAMQPKNKTRLINDDTSIVSAGFVHAGTAGANATFGGFIRKDKTPAQKAQTQKTARIPENELLDLLFKCFEKYKYWPMKALRAELQQPEAYLREQLDRIAVLAKSGKFATNWSLKPEMMQENSARDEEEAAAGAGALDSDMDVDDEDDDADVKFEDVS